MRGNNEVTIMARKVGDPDEESRDEVGYNPVRVHHVLPGCSSWPPQKQVPSTT